jgi:DNA replication protein DnaC
MEEIVRLMSENKIKDTTVEHTGEVCDGCGKDLKIVRIKFENGEVKENQSGCICDRIKYINEQQKRIKSDAFNKASVIHGDYKEKTFENYEPSNEQQETAAKKMKYYAEHFDEMSKESYSLLVQGTFGTGKTHLAAAVRNYLTSTNDKVLFISLPDYMDKLKQGFKDLNQIHPIYKFAKEADLLILDDVGANRMSEWEVSELFRLVDSRRNKSTIYTTNLTSEQFRSSQALYRVFSRMMEKAKVIVIDGADYRMKGVK